MICALIVEKGAAVAVGSGVWLGLLIFLIIGIMAVGYVAGSLIEKYARDIRELNRWLAEEKTRKQSGKPPSGTAS